MTDLRKGSSKDGKTAAATELESELGIVLGNNWICALVVGTFFDLMFALMMITLSLPLFVPLILTNLSIIWGYLVILYFSVHLDLDEGYKIRRWCRKKIVAFSVVTPFQDRSRINKVLFLLEKEEEDRYCSKRTSNDAELEWELKIIFEENTFYAAVCATLCLTFFGITALLGGVLSEKTASCLASWFVIWFWILFLASFVNYYFRGHDLDLGERDKVIKWLRKKIVACSVILPYQDRSRINKALLLMEEEEETQKVEQEHEYSKV